MSADDDKTSAEKLCELMADRPTNPTPGDVGRWWTVGGALVAQLLADLRDTAQGVLELSSIIGKRGRKITELHEEVVQVREQHVKDVELEQALRVKLGEACKIAWRLERADHEPSDAARLTELYSDALDSIPDAQPAPDCLDFAPAGYSGHWRDYHRGHGCPLDPEVR